MHPVDVTGSIDAPFLLGARVLYDGGTALFATAAVGLRLTCQMHLILQQ